MALMAGAVAVVWLVFFNRIFLVSLSPSLARSRGIRAGRIELLFALVVALVVTISIQWVGLLVINAMLLLPAAAARNLARHTAGYVGWAVVIGLAAGLAGLVTSYYADTATGATIVLYAAAVYGITLIPRRG